MLQLLDFDLLLPQKTGVAIVLDRKILLLVGGGQRIRKALGILEGLAIKKVRIRVLLLVVLGEEGSDKILLAELVRLHGWGLRRGDGQDTGRFGGGGKRAARKIRPKNWVGNVK